MRIPAFLLALVWLAMPATAYPCADDFSSSMEGYTIVAVTQVDGTFEGCDYDKSVKFRNGMTLKCSTYSYTYAYAPDAIIFAKPMSHQGQSFYSIEVLIEDDFYDFGVMLK